MEWVRFMHGWPVLDYVAAAAILSTLATLPQSKWNLKKAPQNWLMIGFFFACLMSHMRHAYLDATISTFESFGKIVMMYFLISMNVDSVKRMKSLIRVLIIGCVFLAIHGILQWHRGYGFGLQPPMYIGYYNEYRVVAFGPFNDPNDLALMLVTILPFILMGIHSPNANALARLRNLLLVGGIMYCVFRTNSRGGWLSMGAMLTGYFVVTTRHKKIGAVMGLCAVLLLFAFAPSRMGETDASESSARGRLIAWTSGNTMLKQWPVFGAGKGRYTEFSSNGKVAHNSYVHCYGELGLFGYFFWIALLMASLKDAYYFSRVATDDPDRMELGRIAKVLTASLLGFMVGAFFLSRTYTVPLYVLLATFAALRGISDAEYGPVPGSFVKKDLKLALAVELLSIPAIYILLQVAL